MVYDKILTSTGISFSEDPVKAGEEIAKSALSKLHTKPDFGFVFCSEKKYAGEENIKKLVKSAHKVFMQANPNFNWVGCTTPHVSGCIALIASSKNTHTGIGIGSQASKLPLIAGERAAKEAMSKVELDEHIISYVTSLAEEKHHPSKLSDIHPYFLTMFAPKSSEQKEVLRGIVSVAGSRAPVFKGSGYTFSNGVVFNDSTVVLLQAFDVANDWYDFHNKWLSSVFGHSSLVEN